MYQKIPTFTIFIEKASNYRLSGSNEVIWRTFGGWIQVLCSCKENWLGLVVTVSVLHSCWECKGSMYLTFLCKMSLFFGPNGSEGHRIWIFQNKDPKNLSISPKWYLLDIREICGFLFWTIQILWPSETFGPKTNFTSKNSDRTFAFSAQSNSSCKVQCDPLIRTFAEVTFHIFVLKAYTIQNTPSFIFNRIIAIAFKTRETTEIGNLLW